MTERQAHPLELIREERGISQTALAIRSGVAVRTIRNVERYQHAPQNKTRRKILDALGLPLTQGREIFGP